MGARYVLRGKTVEETLRSFGLTGKEMEIYIFLAKYGIQKGGEIAKKTKIAKPVVFRTLKILQRKGFIESTLESPTRHCAVPFETILDLNIRTKHEEAQQIEAAKADLLGDWSRINKENPESPVETFMVIEGNPKIFAKCYQMVKQTKDQLCGILTVSDLLQADHFDVFSALHYYKAKENIRARFITDLSNLDLKAIKSIRRRLKVLISLRCKNPDYTPRLFPQLLIKDNEEILLFISRSDKKPSESNLQTCLLTNCKAIIQSFSGVFEELWHNSTDIKQKIDEIEIGRPFPKTQIVANPAFARNLYLKALDSAKEEILIVTSSKGLNALSKKEVQLKEWRKRSIPIRIMAPIVSSNLDAMRQLLQWAEVRHIPLGYFETTIIDRNHLFQFESTTVTGGTPSYHNMLYTNDSEYINRTTKLLHDIWRRTRSASARSARSIIQPNTVANNVSIRSDHPSLDNTRFMIDKKYQENTKLTKQDVIDRIMKEKEQPKNQDIDWFEAVKLFGSRAFGIIHPPKTFRLPNIVIGALKHDEASSFGPSNAIAVLAYLECPSGFSFVPVAWVLDGQNPKLIDVLKSSFAGTPAQNNILLFSKDELQLRVRGKTLFAGWTKPIPLGGLAQTLPPSCIIFEGYGKCKYGVFNSVFPSGRKQEVWYVTYDAFLTFYHPKEKYVGTGTDAFFDPCAFQLLYPVAR